jgi:hypothetical protein
MRRRALVAVLGVLAVGLAALAVSAVAHHTTRAFTLGVSPSFPIAPLAAGDTVCQRPIDVAAGAEFDTISARIGTYGQPGSPLAVTVDDLAGRRLAGGRLAGGYPDTTRQPVKTVRLDRTVDAPRIAVCVHNAGTRRAVMYGSIDLAARNSSAYLNGRPLRTDVTLDFGRAPHSMASLVPDMLARASLFRFSGLGSWAYVVLAALLLLVVPALLVRALTRAGAARTPHPPPS